ncbi:MAG: glutamate 5-kinase [Candidatus Pelagibacterales bacterium]|jgi:glutamate 5-kinase|tara:strand:- start:13415 stop:14524 length:1110 start_codon:yes stop_codon:yes gene_type:complete
MKLETTKRIVIKIGSSLLFNKENNKLNKEWLISLAEDVSFLKNQNKDVIIVSSGAIALGAKDLNLEMKELSLDKHQALAAIGQIQLMIAFKNAFEKYESKISQILLTLDDTEKRRRSINARRTIDTLLKLNITPVVNENDTIATNEIKYGDNDRLAARVAQITGADCLILLSNINGLYSADPKNNEKLKLINHVTEINSTIEDMAGSSVSNTGKGGMKTKVMAAKTALSAGCHMAITNGTVNNPVQALFNGRPCTWFEPNKTPLAARKQWIVGTMKPVGSVVIDDGAKQALIKGSSLLPAGIVQISGEFERGDAIEILSKAKSKIGIGLASYSSIEGIKIMGHKSNEIGNILSYSYREEMIHKDDLVLL